MQEIFCGIDNNESFHFCLVQHSSVIRTPNTMPPLHKHSAARSIGNCPHGGLSDRLFVSPNACPPVFSASPPLPCLHVLSVGAWCYSSSCHRCKNCGFHKHPIAKTTTQFTSRISTTSETVSGQFSWKASLRQALSLYQSRHSS